MAYNDGVQTSTMGLNIADSARSGGVARMNYETGIRQSDLRSASGMGAIDSGQIAEGLMRWAEAGGKMTLAQKQEEDAKKRVAAAELKKAKAEKEFRDKADAKSLFSATGGESLDTAGAAGAPFLPSTKEQAKLHTANAGLRKEYEKLYTEDKVDEEQAFINAHSESITEELYTEWENLAPDDPAKKDFIQFAGVQLQNLKEKRHLENFSGLKHLGEIDKEVNYTQLEDHVAKKHRWHVKEQQDTFVDNRVTASFNVDGPPTTIADFDKRVGQWKGQKYKTDGTVGDLIPRKQVASVALEHMTEKVQHSLMYGKSTDPIFDTLKMADTLGEYNQLVDRGDGMGEKYAAYFKEAMNAKESLQKKERAAKDNAEKAGKAEALKLTNTAINEITALKLRTAEGKPLTNEEYQVARRILLLRKDDADPTKYRTAMTELTGLAKSINQESPAYVPAKGSEEEKILPSYTKTVDDTVKSMQEIHTEESKVIQSDEPAWIKLGKLDVLKAHKERLKEFIANTSDYTETEKVNSTNNLSELQLRLQKSVTKCNEGVSGQCEIAKGLLELQPKIGMTSGDMDSWRGEKAAQQKILLQGEAGKASLATTQKVWDLVGNINDGKINYADAEKQFKLLKNPSGRDMEIFQEKTRAFRDKKADDKGIEAGLRFESALAEEKTVKGLKAAVEKELRTNKSLGFNARKDILKFQTKRILEINKGITKDSKKVAEDTKKENSQRSMVNHRTLFNELKDSASMEDYIKNNKIFAKGSTVDIADQGAFQKELQGVIKETKEKEEIKTAGDQQAAISKDLLKMPKNPTVSELQTFEKKVSQIKHEPTRTRMEAVLRSYGDKKKTKEELDAQLKADIVIRKEVRLAMADVNEELTDFIEAAKDPFVPNSASKQMDNLLEYRATKLTDTDFQRLMASDPDNTDYVEKINEAYTKIAELQTDDEIAAKNKTNQENSINSLKDKETVTEKVYTDIFELEENFSQEAMDSFMDNLGVTSEIIDEKTGEKSNPAVLSGAVQDQLRLRARVAKEDFDQKNTKAPTQTDIQYLGAAEYKLDKIRNAVGDAEKNRLIDEVNTWLMNGYTGGQIGAEKLFSSEDFRYYKNKVDSERPDAPKGFEPKSEALQIINSIFTGSVSEDGSPLGGLPLGEGNVLRNDIRSYFGTQWNKNIHKFKKPYMLKREDGMKDMMVVDCNANTQVGDGTCFDDKGLEYAQQVSNMLITPNDNHPLGGGPVDEKGNESWSGRLQRFRNTMLQNLQSGGAILKSNKMLPAKPGVVGDKTTNIDSSGNRVYNFSLANFN